MKMRRCFADPHYWKNPALRRSREKNQNLEKCIFCWFPGRPHPTLSVLIPNPRKIAKPGKIHFLLVCGRAKTWKNCKTWKNAFFVALREGPNAIQRYPSLSQTLEKLQNLEKCIFCWFPGRPQRYPTLSVLIPDPN